MCTISKADSFLSRSFAAVEFNNFECLSCLDPNRLEDYFLFSIDEKAYLIWHETIVESERIILMSSPFVFIDSL
jgi:hypothetical protein